MSSGSQTGWNKICQDWNITIHHARAERAGQVLPILERVPVVLWFSLRFQLEELFIALLRIQQTFGRFRRHLSCRHRLALFVLLLLLFTTLILLGGLWLLFLWLLLLLILLSRLVLSALVLLGLLLILLVLLVLLILLRLFLL